METIKITKKQIIIAIIIFIFSFSLYFLTINFDQKTKIVFCDVGQGDATYIRVKNKIDILIDAGPDKSILVCLGKHMPFWDKKIEIAFLSHTNKDHFQGFYFINERYKILNFITSKNPFERKNYQKLIQNLKKNKVKIKYLFEGEKIRIDKNTSFLFYWPPVNLKSSNENDYSQVMLFEEKNFKILFTGDITSNNLYQIIKKNNLSKIQIIKIPHHGSKNGIDKKILSIIKPKLAVISVGKNNRYGHPTTEIINILKALNIKIKRTDVDKDIIFKLSN